MGGEGGSRGKKPGGEGETGTRRAGARVWTGMGKCEGGGEGGRLNGRVRLLCKRRVGGAAVGGRDRGHHLPPPPPLSFVNGTRVEGHTGGVCASRAGTSVRARVYGEGGRRGRAATGLLAHSGCR